MRRCLSRPSSLLRGSVLSSWTCGSARALATYGNGGHGGVSNPDHPHPGQYRSKQGGEGENDKVEVVATEAVLNPNSDHWTDEANWDPHARIWAHKILRLKDELNLSAEKVEKFLSEYDVSRGSKTIEWALPSPPPEHTFEELPILKEVEDEVSTTLESRISKLLESTYKAKAVTAEQNQAFEALAKEFGFSEREKLAMKELMQRYAKHTLPSFPNEYEEHAHGHGH